MLPNENQIHNFIPNFNTFNGWEKIETIHIDNHLQIELNQEPVISCLIRSRYEYDNTIYNISMYFYDIIELNLQNLLPYLELNEIVIEYQEEENEPLKKGHFIFTDETLGSPYILCRKFMFTRISKIDDTRNEIILWQFPFGDKPGYKCN